MCWINGISCTHVLCQCLSSLKPDITGSNTSDIWCKQCAAGPPAPPLHNFNLLEIIQYKIHTHNADKNLILT